LAGPLITDPSGATWQAPSLASAEREAVRWGGFAEFARLCMPHVPKAPLRPLPLARVHHELARHVEAFRTGAIMNLLANLPPGIWKSTLVSILFPAYVWTIDPTAQFIVAAYEPKMSTDFAVAQLGLMQSAWFVERWGDIVVTDGIRQDMIWTTSRGRRFSTSAPGGNVTGKHARYYVLDDLYKARVAGSAVQRKPRATMQEVNDWIGSSVLTRGRPGEDLQVLHAVQRLHEEDSSWCIIDTFKGTERFEHLVLPYKFERERRCVTSIGGDWRQHEGERIWSLPDLERKATVIARKEGGWNGSVMRAQYQQDPSGGTDTIFKAPFKTFRAEDRRPFREMISCISVDPTFTGKENSDFVAIEVWSWDGGDYLCWYSETRRRGFEETHAAIRAVRAAWPVTFVLIEEAANGHALVETLGRVLPGVVGVKVAGGAGKPQRARAASYHFTAGRVMFLEGAEWFDEKTRALVRFPDGAHDDSVDTTSQALLWLASEFGGGEDMMAAVAEYQAEQSAAEVEATREKAWRYPGMGIA
jgi:predicted phage terminase large subunit-like protein